MAPAKPLQLLWSAITRTTAEGNIAGPDQVVDIDTALKAITIAAAHSISLEDEIGSITPGKLANLTILEENPYEVAPKELARIKVCGTVLEGRLQPVDRSDVQTELRNRPKSLHGHERPWALRTKADAGPEFAGVGTRDDDGCGPGDAVRSTLSNILSIALTKAG